MSFAHLHLHSEYSWLDGLCNIDKLVHKAVQYIMPAVAVTDRNSLAGAYHLWHKCIECGINPIIGLEIEVLNDIGDGKSYSVILLAKNGNGYLNLCRLVTLAYEYSPETPMITKTQLKAYADELICLSFSVKGELCTLLLEGKDDEAREVSDWYYSVFGDDYYYEIQNHGLPNEAIAMNKLLNLAYYTKIPAVLTNDCHYFDRKDSIAIDALYSIRKSMDFSDPEASRFASNEYFFKSPEELEPYFSSNFQLIQNSIEIAKKIDVTGGYIPSLESSLTLDNVVELLKNFSSSIHIKTAPNSRHIRVLSMDNQFDAILEYLREKLPNYNVIHFTEYERWTVADIYAEVLRVLKVPEGKINDLRKQTPYEARSLIEAALINPEFSSLTDEDSVHSLAFNISQTLLNSFKKVKPKEDNFVLVHKDIPIPIARELDGTARCQYDFDNIKTSGAISLSFE